MFRWQYESDFGERFKRPPKTSEIFAKLSSEVLFLSILYNPSNNGL